MMGYFLFYSSPAIRRENEFVGFYPLLESGFLPISVIPFFIITLQNIFLWWWRPANVERSLVVASLACLLVDWASSILVQIPMNLELNQGKNLQLINAVMDTNWGRVFLESIQV